MADLTRDEIACLRALLDDACQRQIALACSPEHYGHWCALEIAKDRIAEWVLSHAPALLDAAERGADDDGLKFWPVSTDHHRYAVGVDGELYSVRHRWGDDGWWARSYDAKLDVTCATEEQAIEAARAHDRARRGAR